MTGMYLELDTLLRILRAVGIFPFEVYPSKVVFSRKYYAWTLFLSVATPTVNLSQHEVTLNFDSDFNTSARIVYVTCLLAIYVPNVIQPLLQGEEIIRVTSNLRRERSSRVCIRVSSPPLLLLVVPFTHLSSVNVWALYHSSEYFSSEDWDALCFYVATFMEHFLVVEFVVVIQGVLSCLEQTVARLRRRRNVDELIGQWDKRLDAIDAFLRYFGLQMLFIVCFLLVMIVVFLFCAMNRNQDSWSLYLYVLPWCAVYVGQILAVVLVCSATSRKASEFSKTLYSYAIRSHEYSHNDKVLLHLVRKRKLTFSLFGFFEINRGFLTSVVSTCMTYLVIMFQMKPANELKGDKIE